MLLCTVAFYFDSGGLTAALLIAAGLHELGHVLASLLMGGLNGLWTFPFGGVRTEAAALDGLIRELEIRTGESERFGE